MVELNSIAAQQAMALSRGQGKPLYFLGSFRYFSSGFPLPCGGRET
jgi:hypothetical protein